MTTTIRYVGLDVHKNSVVVAVAEASGGDAKVWGRIDSNSATVERTRDRLGGPQQVQACYEAGPTG